MPHKIIIIILVIFVQHRGFSQQQLSSNIFIYDKKYDIPVEDAIISLKNGVVFTSDRNGKIEIPQNLLDTITVSHLSYTTLTTVIDMKYIDTIFLDQRIIELKSVTVSPKRRKRIGASTQNGPYYGKLSAYRGFEKAQKFKLPKSPSRLLELNFYVAEIEGIDSALMKFYFFNIVNGMPGKIINDQQILYMLKQQKENSIDLSPYNIEMNDDFILSMQFMNVYTTPSGKPPYITIPVKIDLVGEIFWRTPQTGWEKKKGGSLSVNILTSY